jgi:DNA-binding winged helix-turn-helix (wHTH) protein
VVVDIGRSLRCLSSAARDLLNVLAVVSGGMPVAELGCAGMATDELDGALAGFLHVAADRTVAIDEIARGTVLRLATVAQLVRAHRSAARMYIARRAAGGPEAGHAAVEAAHHLRASGDHADTAVLGGLAPVIMLGRHTERSMGDEFTVDVTSGTLTGRKGSLKGRPVTCALLACLIDADGEPVPADILYCTVWGTEQYHPLRHRNTLYSAINRLRRVLTDVGGDGAGELVETLPSGWRLGHGRARRIQQEISRRLAW